MVCVKLIATDKANSDTRYCLFLGSIRYEGLKKVYDSKAPLTSRLATRMSFGFGLGSGRFSSLLSTQRIELVKMRGPAGRGSAEMAVTKPKNCDFLEAPISEPSLSLADFQDWDQAEVSFP